MPQVYCDMDGVLVDLLQGYRDLTGQCLTNLRGVGDQKWLPALGVANFWETLPKMPDADELMDYFEKFVPAAKLHVLSAPQHLFADCAVQKLKWLDEHATVFRIKRANVVDRKRKPEFAIGENGQPNILIDDYEKNIREWEAAGGIAIHHTSAENTIKELAAYYN